MPLSEQEQRLLDEMERNLYHGDTDFGSSVGRPRGRSGSVAIVGGVVLAVLGVGLLILGVLLQNWLVGVLGFAAMFGGVLLVVGGRGAPAGFPAAGGRPRPGLMDRLNERWERRRSS